MAALAILAPARLLALVLCAAAAPHRPAPRHPVCVAVAVEGIPSLVCARPARRR